MGEMAQIYRLDELAAEWPYGVEVSGQRLCLYKKP